MDKLTGRELLTKVEAWIGSWIVFRREADAMICALWVLLTWVYEDFDTVPYLCISAATKGAGKTALLETVAALSRNAEQVTDVTKAALMRLAEMDAYKINGAAAPGVITYFVDEADRMNRESCDAREYFNSGYRQGGAIPRTMPGGAVVKFPTFGPKAFALIGDVYDTLRDRCIVIRLVRSATPKRFRPTVMRQEARELGFLVREVMEQYRGGVEPVADSEISHLQGRDLEIWEPMFSLAAALGVSRDTWALLLRESQDLTGEKTAEARSYIELRATAEQAAQADQYAERALADLRSTLREGEPAIWSVVAVERMKEIPTAPWRTFRGAGLTVDSLASLLSRFGVTGGSSVRMVAGKGAKAAPMKRGYSRAALDRAVMELGNK